MKMLSVCRIDFSGYNLKDTNVWRLFLLAQVTRLSPDVTRLCLHYLFSGTNTKPLFPFPGWKRYKYCLRGTSPLVTYQPHELLDTWHLVAYQQHDLLGISPLVTPTTSCLDPLSLSASVTSSPLLVQNGSSRRTVCIRSCLAVGSSHWSTTSSPPYQSGVGVAVPGILIEWKQLRVSCSAASSRCAAQRGTTPAEGERERRGREEEGCSVMSASQVVHSRG